MADMQETNLLHAARHGNPQAFADLTEPFRHELRVHCYRILGSLQDAEDLVQETLLRAWKRLDTFEGRATIRAWLYKIATNACIDALDKQRRRILPTQVYPPTDPQEPFAPPMAESIWLEPFPDELLTEKAFSPEARYAARESITLAFLTTLQLLPPRQRAIIILRDVLDWQASEVATMLDLTVSAVNSALHRARTTLNKHNHGNQQDVAKANPDDASTRSLLDQYVKAWESADMAKLVALLKEEAILSMPPSPSWYRGRDAIGKFFSRTIIPGMGHGKWGFKPIYANGHPAFAVYEPDQSDGTSHAHAIHVLTCDNGQVARLDIFLNPALFPRFGLASEIRS